MNKVSIICIVCINCSVLYFGGRGIGLFLFIRLGCACVYI